MKAMQALVYGLPDGTVRLECDRFGCGDWAAYLPPHSTLLDIERALKRHTHPRKAA